MKKSQNKLLIAVLTLGAVLGGCDSLIFDDYEDCPQGVYVKFFSMTPCETDSTFLGNVSSLTLFAFDENEKLVSSVTENNVVLTSDYEILVPVSNGVYSFIAWTGIDDNFTVGTFTEGVTTKHDVMLSLKSANNIAANLSATRVWYGESLAVFLPDPILNGSVFKHTSINLKELTNRLKIVVEFDPSVEHVVPKDLSVSVSSANGVVHINGTMPQNSPVLAYAPLQTVYTDNSVSWDFSLLDLVTGYKNHLEIVYSELGQKIFDGDLIASILLNTVGEGINLACENDFTVKFVLKDYCAECEKNFICVIYVNDWIVHNYRIELGR
mgnify:CR=1 FL=1